MDAQAIPDAALAQHIAILGKTGSGKTSTAKLAIEQVVDRGFRVCILDAVKSDWWGITSSGDGKRPGLPFRILGGPRGHVPLHSSAGKAIGQLVGEGKLPLSIIDMADFEPGGLQRFFVDFAPALMRHARGVVYLVIEEAHEFAPKERAGIGAENLAIHWAKKLATAGRSKGIRLVVATQRIQSLHNAVLGSCETVVAHRLTTPSDQKPVVDWLRANAGKETMEEVAASLSSLPTGTGWLCSGEAGIFDKVAFPRFRTYDNTATPTGDEDAIDVQTAPVDADELRAIIGDAVKDAEAEDPKALRKRIADLERELSRKDGTIDQTAVDAAERRGYDRGHVEGRHEAMEAMIAREGEVVDAVIARANDIISAAGGLRSLPLPISDSMRKLVVVEAASTPPPQPRPKPATRLREASSTGLTGPQAHLLKALAWWQEMGHPTPTRTQIAAIAGWKPKGSNLRNRLSELSGAGLVYYPGEGKVGLTEAGDQAAPEPDLDVTLIDSIRAVLTGPQLLLFDALRGSIDHRTSRAELAQRIGWEPAGSNLRNRLSELSALELVEYPARGEVALQAWVTAQ